MKPKVTFTAAILVFAFLVTVGAFSGEHKIVTSVNKAATLSREPEIIVETDHLQYEAGESIEIAYTNVGNAIAGFVIGISRPTIPWIVDASSGAVLFLTDPNDTYTAMMLYGVLLPGESFTVDWDQQYYGYQHETFSPPEQVPPGEYFVELGYWKVTGEYMLPTYVPGGPPEHFAKSCMFTINEQEDPEIVITTDQLDYCTGENVEITYTNAGDAIAGFVIGTSRPTIPGIIDEYAGEKLFLTDPYSYYTYVMMYGVLLPGESFTVIWDQQYYGYYSSPFSPAEQVPPGCYHVELGYWKVTEDYLAPYYVPGGPPDIFAQSETFTVW